MNKNLLRFAACLMFYARLPGSVFLCCIDRLKPQPKAAVQMLVLSELEMPANNAQQTVALSAARVYGLSGTP